MRASDGKIEAVLRISSRTLPRVDFLSTLLQDAAVFPTGEPPSSENIAFCVVLQATIATSSLAACFVDQRNFSLCGTASAFPVHLGIKKLDRFRPKPYICLFVEICHKVLAAHQSPSI